jgi:glycine betaine/proline transport system substrate-binding protein
MATILRLTVACIATASVGLTACSSSTTGLVPSGDAGASDVATAENGVGGERAVKLVRNGWLGSDVDVTLAKALMTEKMGLSVTIVDEDETKQWPRIASGELDACLEVWPSGHHDDLKNFVDTGKVENIGELGALGRIGWYIPKYMLTDYPQLATWEGFQDPKIAKLFATPDTGTNGRFLGVDPSYTQFDEAIIKNLKLPFTVKFSGTEDATIAELDKAYINKSPILFYFWVPHWAVNKYELTAVQLPTYTDACYAGTPDKIACDYPADHLLKVVAPTTKTSAPRAYAFLQKFKIATKDQIAMMARVKLESKTTDAVVHDWITANPTTWAAWVAPGK